MTTCEEPTDRGELISIEKHGVEVTFKKSTIDRGKGEASGVARFPGFTGVRTRWNTRFRMGVVWVTVGVVVAVLYERVSHKLSRLFKKLEKGARSLVKQLASRVAGELFELL